MINARTIPPFQLFYEEHGPAVYRFLAASVPRAEAEDCFQETFLAALRAYPNLRNADNLRGWVMAIAANKIIDAGRARSRRPVSVADVEHTGAGGVVSRDAAHDGFDPNDPTWSAVRALPERMRTAVVLRHVLDLPYEEVAVVMGGTEDAARANVHQGLKRLRTSLAPAASAAAEEGEAR
jgi:RNA polymerase sigma factor (sigma-70 family)